MIIPLLDDEEALLVRAHIVAANLARLSEVEGVVATGELLIMFNNILQEHRNQGLRPPEERELWHIGQTLITAVQRRHIMTKEPP